MDRYELLYKITKTKPCSMSLCDKFAERKLMRFTGDQWNADWDWNIGQLETLTSDELQSVYSEVLKSREEIYGKKK